MPLPAVRETCVYETINSLYLPEHGMRSKLTLKQLRELAQEIAHDSALAKAEAEHRRRLEKFGSVELEQTMLRDTGDVAEKRASAEPAERGPARGMER
jgi:hypothetical protein